MGFPKELGMTKEQKNEQVLKFRDDYKHLPYHELEKQFEEITEKIRSLWKTDSFETTTDKRRQAEMMEIICRRTAYFEESKSMRHMLN